MKSPLFPKKVKILDVKKETGDSIRIRLNWQVAHDPGQFVQVGIPGIGEAPISIASYSKDYIDLHVRIVGNVTTSLSNLNAGDSLWVRGPYGKGYPMEFLEGDSVILIGGGCGVAPLKGVLDYLEKNRAKYKDISLFFGYRQPDEILFKEKEKLWKKTFNLHLTVDKNPGKTCYAGDVGFVTELVKKKVKDNADKVAFICGPPMMMNICVDILHEKGFNDDQIFVSTERLMQCAIGICGHCMIHGKYTCKDGPVFRYDEIKNYKND